MPTYSYTCRACGDMDITHSIHDEAWEKCPKCGKRGLTRNITLSVHFHPPKDSSWENLNDGKGMYISGLGRRTDDNAYCRSLHEATEKAKKLGKSYEIA